MRTEFVNIGEMHSRGLRYKTYSAHVSFYGFSQYFYGALLPLVGGSFFLPFPSPKTLGKTEEKGHCCISCCCPWSCSHTATPLAIKAKVTERPKGPTSSPSEPPCVPAPLTSLFCARPRPTSTLELCTGCSHYLESPPPGSLPSYYLLKCQLPQPHSTPLLSPPVLPALLF